MQARGGRLRSRLPRRALLGASDLKATPSKETRFWSRFQSLGWGRELKFTVVSSTRTGLCTGALYIAPSRSSKASSVHWPLPPAVPTRGHGARALKSPRRGRATSWGGRVTSPRSLHLCCTKREERPAGVAPVCLPALFHVRLVFVKNPARRVPLPSQLETERRCDVSPVTVDTSPILQGSRASALPPAARAGHPQRPSHTCAEGHPGQDPTRRWAGRGREAGGTTPATWLSRRADR